MQIVPIIPQQKYTADTSLQVKGVAAAHGAKPVQERTLPPLVSYPHEPLQNTAEEILPHDKRQVAEPEERRLMCRRIFHFPVLEELRSLIDRRHHNHRTNDFQLHIDEEA